MKKKKESYLRFYSVEGSLGVSDILGALEDSECKTSEEVTGR